MQSGPGQSSAATEEGIKRGEPRRRRNGAFSSSSSSSSGSSKVETMAQEHKEATPQPPMSTELVQGFRPRASALASINDAMLASVTSTQSGKDYESSIITKSATRSYWR